jgi:NDP-sugar pyrophosphorylase family protein
MSLTWPTSALERVLQFASAPAASIKAACGIILCAGAGQRMAPLTDTIPKPLLPVLNCPLLWWSISRLRNVVEQVRINTHHLEPLFAPLDAIAGEAGIPFARIQETGLSGPFGGLLSCCKSIDLPDHAIVLAGDGFYDTDFAKLLATHRAFGAHLTIGISHAIDGSRYGILTSDDEGRVVRMREKPPGIGPTQHASCGVYVVSAPVVARFADHEADLDWVDVVQVLLVEGYDVREAIIETWHDSGTPQDLLTLNLAMLTEEWLNAVADRVVHAGASLWRQGELSVSGEARFGGHVLLGPGVVVEPGASISNAVVGPGAHIGSGAEIANALILPGAHIPPNARVSDAVWS